MPSSIGPLGAAPDERRSKGPTQSCRSEALLEPRAARGAVRGTVRRHGQRTELMRAARRITIPEPLERKSCSPSRRTIGWRAPSVGWLSPSGSRAGLPAARAGRGSSAAASSSALGVVMAKASPACACSSRLPSFVPVASAGASVAGRRPEAAPGGRRRRGAGNASRSAPCALSPGRFPSVALRACPISPIEAVRTARRTSHIKSSASARTRSRARSLLCPARSRANRSRIELSSMLRDR